MSRDTHVSLKVKNSYLFASGSIFIHFSVYVRIQKIFRLILCKQSYSFDSITNRTKVLKSLSNQFRRCREKEEFKRIKNLTKRHSENGNLMSRLHQSLILIENCFIYSTIGSISLNAMFLNKTILTSLYYYISIWHSESERGTKFGLHEIQRSLWSNVCGIIM